LSLPGHTIVRQTFFTSFLSWSLFWNPHEALTLRGTMYQTPTISIFILEVLGLDFLFYPRTYSSLASLPLSRLTALLFNLRHHFSDWSRSLQSNRKGFSGRLTLYETLGGCKDNPAFYLPPRFSLYANFSFYQPPEVPASSLPRWVQGGYHLAGITTTSL